eukprot:6634086-Alexandrium_andersonii.AAC.1
MNIAGSSCTGVSSMGARQADGDATMRPMSIWAAGNVKAKTDLVVHEWTQLGDASILDRLYGKDYSRRTQLTNPWWQGWPVDRTRMMSCLFNTAEVQWVGPEKMAEDYENIFHKRCMLDASVFEKADDAEILADARQLAKNRGLYLDKNTTVADINFKDLLPPNMRDSLSKWEAKQASHCSLNGELYCNPGQDPSV